MPFAEIVRFTDPVIPNRGNTGAHSLMVNGAVLFVRGNMRPVQVLPNARKAMYASLKPPIYQVGFGTNNPTEPAIRVAVTNVVNPGRGDIPFRLAAVSA